MLLGRCGWSFNLETTVGAELGSLRDLLSAVGAEHVSRCRSSLRRPPLSGTQAHEEYDDCQDEERSKSNDDDPGRA